MNERKKIYFFDTTLRDGEQSAGVHFNKRAKLEIALQLESLGVDIIEAGFPCTSEGDLQAVKLISEKIKDSGVCALARAVEKDIDIAWQGVRSARIPTIHIFINSSTIQMAHQLRKNRDQVLEQAKKMVAYGAKLCPQIEFSPMDATRSERDFLFQIIEECINAGATVINIPDSVGYSIPEETAQLFQDIHNNVPNLDKARLSFHGQNDLGLCSANTLTAIQNGVRQVEVTVNGIGERAGNTALEEIVMAIHTRADFFPFYTDIKTSEIYKTSKLVELYSGMPIQHNKAIVGKNAFRHESGIHQDGILKLRETWEIMDPKEIGIPQGTQIVLGKLSGRHAFKVQLEKLGYRLKEDELEKSFLEFKELCDKKDSIDDRDIEAIVSDSLTDLEDTIWKLDSVHVVAGNQLTPSATIQLTNAEGKQIIDAAIGHGPVNAVCNCINRIVSYDPELSYFDIKNVTEGVDAQGEVTIKINYQGITYMGRYANTDILVASAHAYLNAINRLIAAKDMSKAL